MYPNTRGLALEEIGALFGDETVTAHEATVLEVDEDKVLPELKKGSLEQHDEI